MHPPSPVPSLHTHHLSLLRPRVRVTPRAMSNPAASLPPGFRFHPTDEELILHYLSNRAASLPYPVSIIADVDIYKFDPWDLPGKAMFGDREWYFFSPRERKYPNGVRPNRAAASGYWKATGTDKPVAAAGKGKGSIGVKKALVFYKGRPPKGVKTDWVMHEYRLTQARNHHGSKPVKLGGSSMRLDDWVLCRIYKKNHHRLPSTARAPAGSSGDDAHLSDPPNIKQQDNLKLQSSSSLCELLEAADYSILSRLFDGPPELLGSEQCRLAGYASPVQPSISSCDYSSNGDPNSLRPLTGADLPAPIPWSCPKRRRMADGCSEEGGGASDSFNQQLLNYHLGLL